jgi:16S rRNA (cytosine967-C5)-methyltransferase
LVDGFDNRYRWELFAWMLQKNHGMQLEGYELIKGYEDKADTMFVARLIKK